MAEVRILSLKSVTRTVSRSMNSDWDVDLASLVSHVEAGGGVIVDWFSAVPADATMKRQTLLPPPAIF